MTKKKLIYGALGCVMALGLVACASTATESTTETSTATSETATSESTGEYKIYCYVNGEEADNEDFGLPETATSGDEVVIKYNGEDTYNLLVLGSDTTTEYARVTASNSIEEVIEMPDEAIQVTFNN